jgi:hypothetical protein
VRVSDVNHMLGTTLPSENGRTVESLAGELWREPLSEGDAVAAPGGGSLVIESLVGSRLWSVRVKPPRGRAAA